MRKLFLLAFLFLALAGSVPAQGTIQKSIQPEPEEAEKLPLIDASLADEMAVGQPARLVFPFAAGETPGAIRVTPHEDQGRQIVIGDPERDGTNWTVPLIPLSPEIETIKPLNVVLAGSDNNLTAYETEAFAVTIPEPAQVEEQVTETNIKKLLWPNLVIGTVVFLGALLAIFLIRKFLLGRNDQAGSLASVETRAEPLPEAREALRRLKLLDVYRTQGSTEHYKDLSFLVRRYVEREHSVPALEYTEDEMVRLFEQRFVSSPGAQNLIGVFYRASMAKFARVEIDQENVQRDLEWVETWLDGESERKRLESLRSRQKEEAA